MSAGAVREVRLYCPGGYHGTAIAASGYYRAPCRKQDCRTRLPNGTWAHPTHVWDLDTGWLTEDPTRFETPAAEPEGATAP